MKKPTQFKVEYQRPQLPAKVKRLWWLNSIVAAVISVVGIVPLLIKWPLGGIWYNEVQQIHDLYALSFLIPTIYVLIAMSRAYLLSNSLVVYKTSIPLLLLGSLLGPWLMTIFYRDWLLDTPTLNGLLLISLSLLCSHGLQEQRW